MMYQAVLFDLDGTLLNTLRDIADSANSVLAYLGFPQHEVEAYKYFIGDGIRALAVRALPEGHRNEMIVDKIVAHIEEEYSSRWVNNTHPYQGIPELLNMLTNFGIKMAILSNKPQNSAELMVSRLLPQWHFEFVVGASPSIPRKPDPTAAVQIARQMNISPIEFLYLGDSAVDMKTAIAANMYPVGVLWGFRMADELLSAGAKVLIQQPSQLLRLIDK
jgi:phosphoglycolate phosphatase